ncbi:MAG: RraA family protein [Pseudomonadota bacterium]
MIEEPPLITVQKPDRRPTSDQIAAFQNVPTGFVADAMNGVGALSFEIAPVDPEGRLPHHVAGPALTSDCSPGDILATLTALKFVQAGDVLVAGFAGFRGCAAAGDRVCGMAKNGGAVGFVTDGPMRDLDGIAAAGLPAWCIGLTPNSPTGSGPGKVGTAIQIGGRHVETGDMVIADKDGVVTVPFDMIATVLDRLKRVSELEHDLDAQVAEGLSCPPSIDDLLASDDVAFVER